MLKCEAECAHHTGECSGEVQIAKITAPDGYDWGKFNYCQTAGDKDAKNGFTVDALEQ